MAKRMKPYYVTTWGKIEHGYSVDARDEDEARAIVLSGKGGIPDVLSCWDEDVIKVEGNA